MDILTFFCIKFVDIVLNTCRLACWHPGQSRGAMACLAQRPEFESSQRAK